MSGDEKEKSMSQPQDRDTQFDPSRMTDPSVTPPTTVGDPSTLQAPERREPEGVSHEELQALHWATAPASDSADDAGAAGETG